MSSWRILDPSGRVVGHAAARWTGQIGEIVPPPPAPASLYGMPQIRLPAGTPCFLAAGHGITPDSVYADVRMRTGHARKRRIYTSAPRVVDVAWVLEAEQMTAVDAWYEDVLLAGERAFAAQVKAQGPGKLWWRARWVEPYEAEAMHLGRWRVTGRLLLTGVGQVEDPYIPEMEVEFGAALTATAVLTVVPLLGVEFGAALTGTATPTDALWTQSGEFILTQNDEPLLLA